MKKPQLTLSVIGCLVLGWPFSVLATQAETVSAVTDTTTKVGSKVAGNLDSASMLLSLLMVLAVIFLSAYVLKRFNLVQQNHSELKVVTSLVLGNKERVVVVQVADKQVLLGVTAHQITLLDTLSSPIVQQTPVSNELAKTVTNFLVKSKNKK